MQLRIDGQNITAKAGQSLLDLVRQLNLDSPLLSCRPLAAKIAGEVFNLNYIPVREKDVQTERPSIRRAMAASQGHVTLLHYTDPAGKDVYARTAQFLLFLALHNLYPNVRVKMGCTVGKALYMEVLSLFFPVFPLFLFQSFYMLQRCQVFSLPPKCSLLFALHLCFRQILRSKFVRAQPADFQVFAVLPPNVPLPL